MCWGGASGSVAGIYKYTGSSSWNTGDVRPGYAGTASSFGSYVSAAGGTAPSQPSLAVAPPPGGNAGSYSKTATYGYGGVYMALPGAPGWLPDWDHIPAYAYVYNGTMSVSSSSVSSSTNVTLNLPTGPADLSASTALSAAPPLCLSGRGYAGAAHGVPYANGTHTTMNAAFCPGAIGYGAGGSRTPYGEGYSANSGGIQKAAIKLTSSAAISVTVGKGGAARKWTRSDTSYIEYGLCFWSGAGADGCVAVFW